MNEAAEEFPLPSSGEEEPQTAKESEDTDELLGGDTMTEDHETRSWSMTELKEHFDGLITLEQRELTKTVDPPTPEQRSQVVAVGNYARKYRGIVHDLEREGVTSIDKLPKGEFNQRQFVTALSEYTIPEDKSDRTQNVIFKAEARERIQAIAKKAEEDLARAKQRDLELAALKKGTLYDDGSQGGGHNRGGSGGRER